MIQNSISSRWRATNMHALLDEERGADGIMDMASTRRYVDQCVEGIGTYCKRGGRFYRVLPQVEFIQ